MKMQFGSINGPGGNTLPSMPSIPDYGKAVGATFRQVIVTPVEVILYNGKPSQSIYIKR